MLADLMNWIIALLQTFLFIALAKANKCLLQNRLPPPLWQPYRDLRKLFRKEAVVAEQASWIFRTTPYIVFATTVLAAGVLPLIATDLPTAAIADVMVLVGFFAPAFLWPSPALTLVPPLVAWVPHGK